LATIVLVAAALVIGTLISTWQAVRATRAERLADDRLIAETQARAAEAQQRKQAEAQQAAAEANFEKAKTTVDRYFTLVSEDKLLDVPGLQPLREDLLESALEFYQNLAVERPDDLALLADLAVTYLRLSHVYIALDRADDAATAIRQALDTTSRLQSHPEADRYERKLAGFCRGVRWTQGAMTPPRDPIGAFQTLLRLEATWRKLAQKHPSNAAMQSDLASIQGLVGLLMAEVKRRPEAIRFFRQSLAIDERLSAEYPNVPRYRGDQADASIQLARYLREEGNVDEANALLRQGVDVAEALVKQHPEIPAYRRTLATGLFNLSGEIGEDRPQEGMTMIVRAVDLAESLVREHPKIEWYRELWDTGAAGATGLGNRLKGSKPHPLWKVTPRVAGHASAAYSCGECQRKPSSARKSG
jgi:tetratricopeptide (TPR) repeat protein